MPGGGWCGAAACGFATLKLLQRAAPMSAQPACAWTLPAGDKYLAYYLHYETYVSSAGHLDLPVRAGWVAPRTGAGDGGEGGVNRVPLQTWQAACGLSASLHPSKASFRKQKAKPGGGLPFKRTDSCEGSTC